MTINVQNSNPSDNDDINFENTNNQSSFTEDLSENSKFNQKCITKVL